MNQELKWFEFTAEATKLSTEYDQDDGGHEDDEDCWKCYQEKQMQDGCECECHHEIYQQQTMLVCAESEEHARKHLEKHDSFDTMNIAEEKFTSRENFRDYVLEVPGDCDEISSGVTNVGCGKLIDGNMFIGKVITVHEAWE